MNKAKKRNKINWCDRDDNQVFVEFGPEIGLAEKQFVHPRLTRDGKPYPLIAMSFDGLTANTRPNYHRAGVELADKHFGGAHIVPSFDEFRKSHDFQDCSLLHELGIPRIHELGTPRNRHFYEIWSLYVDILEEMERVRPSLLNPWIPDLLQDACKHFHPVIVTSNRTHDIAEMITKQARIEKFDVVIVPARKLDDVLWKLAIFHHSHHGSVRIPFSYFCATVQDAEAAGSCGKWVRPYGVVGPDVSTDERARDYFVESLKRCGVTPIQPEEMLAAVYGLHSMGFPTRFLLS